MILTQAILKEAEKWLGCTETSRHRSSCIDEIHKQFSAGWNGSPDAWCAKFVWSMTEIATKKLEILNPLHKSASTVQMLNKTDLRKDSEPAKGSIFFISRVCAGGGKFTYALLFAKELSKFSNVLYMVIFRCRRWTI
jgi:hypothetical protein